MIATSLDGQWVTIRRGRDVVLLASGAAPPVGQLELADDDADVAIVGPPSVVVVVSRGSAPKVVGHQPPYLDAAARLDLDAPMVLAAVTGQRLALVGGGPLGSAEAKQVLIVRAAGRTLASQPLDVGGPIEFVVGLERNQLLFALPRKLEVWDAVSARPLLRLQLQLPPPPRTVGAAQGHLWVTRPGSDEVFVYRLSDGRPFRHYVGAPVERVICHPASPLIVLVTPRGLVRLHCFAHSLTVVDTPWAPGTPLAQLAAGDDISLIGLGDGDAEPWRVPISGAGAPIATTEPAEPSEPVLTTAADKLRAMRERAAGSAPADSAGSSLGVTATTAPAPMTAATTQADRGRTWREPLAGYGLELSRGLEGELPVVAIDTELGELAHRLALPSHARRALVALYGLYLVGEPALSIARLASVLGDWTEALGGGALGALALLRRRGGKVTLRPAVTDLLDGLPPRAIRVVGGGATTPRPGLARLARGGRSDAAIETELATRHGRIAVITGAARRGALEARLHGATAIALVAPRSPVEPMPDAAGLIVVDDGAAPPWVQALATYA